MSATRKAHVAIFVRWDVAQSVEFYQKMFGSTPSQGSHRLCQVRYCRSSAQFLAERTSCSVLDARWRRLAKATARLTSLYRTWEFRWGEHGEKCCCARAMDCPGTNSSR